MLMRPGRHHRQSACRALFSGALVGLLMLLPPAAAHDEHMRVEILTHPQLTQTQLDRGALRAMFSMRQRTWPDGQRVQVFVFPDQSDEHLQFCREVLGTFPYVLRSIWDRLVFTGTGFAPVEVGSAEEMRRRVKETPGAIGYVIAPHAGDSQPVSLLAKPKGDSPVEAS